MPGWQGARKDPAYNTSAWKRARLACLRAANWRCQAKLQGCAGAASQADHVDGLANDPGHRNLRAVCTPCHRRITAQQGQGYRAREAIDPEPKPRTNW
jgi:hypothetical protein